MGPQFLDRKRGEVEEKTRKCTGPWDCYWTQSGQVQIVLIESAMKMTRCFFLFNEIGGYSIYLYFFKIIFLAFCLY